MLGKASNEDRRMKIRNMSVLKKCAKYVLKYVRYAVAFSKRCFDVWGLTSFRTKKVGISRYADADGKMQPQLRYSCSTCTWDTRVLRTETHFPRYKNFF